MTRSRMGSPEEFERLRSERMRRPPPTEPWMNGEPAKSPAPPDDALFAEETSPLHERSPALIRATPFILRDPAEIPPRRFVYGRHYIRRFVSGTIAPGGVGKSSLELAEALAMTTGRNLLGQDVVASLRVWHWNGEDPLEELERRIAAICAQHALGAEHLGDRLFLDSGRTMQICIARTERGDVKIAEPIVDQMIRTLGENHIDVLQLDPFVETHQVGESDNGAINRVARQWQHVADATNASIELVHHARKPASGTNGEITVDDSRGASALVSAVRSARVLNRMTKEEATVAGVENHRLYFRIDNGKANLAPPSDVATWCRLASVSLPNGDNVGVVTPWTWPDPFADVTAAAACAVQKRIAEKQWRQDVRASDWAGNAVAEVLELDLDEKPDREKVKGLLKTWIKNGALKVVKRPDEHRHEKAMIEVGQWLNA